MRSYYRDVIVNKSEQSFGLREKDKVLVRNLIQNGFREIG